MSRAAVIRGISALALCAALAAPAMAQQEMYPGQSVQVNPTAAGNQVLLYPDGRHVRTVPQLLHPGEALNKPIQLRKPTKRKRVAHRTPQTQVASVEPLATPVPVQAAPARPKRVAVAKPPAPTPAPQRAAPRPAPTPSAQLEPQRSRAQRAQAATTTGADVNLFSSGTPNYAAEAERLEREARRNPQSAAPQSQSANLARRSQIIFAAGAPAPAPNALDAIRLLGGDLSSALQAGAERIQLQAYGGARNDKGSDARRLSLKRAIAIRKILIDAGVPSAKIDVRAMGGADSGPADRVDVYVRG